MPQLMHARHPHPGWLHKIIIGLIGLIGLTSVARAEDPKKDSLTVLPWTQASLLFSADEKLGVVEFSQRIGDRWAFHIKASAPIDKDTRVAAFVKDGHLSSGFTGSFEIGYNQLEEQENKAFAAAGLVADDRALQRRNLSLTGAPVSKAVGRALPYSMSLHGQASYDRLSVYQDDLAASPLDAVKYDLGVGATFTLYGPVPGLAFTTRAGFDREQDSGAEAVERCVQPTSTSSIVSGKQCDPQALFRMGAAPDAETTGYLRFAVTYQYSRGKPSQSQLIPGVEARVGLEGLFADKSLATRLTLFGTPVSGSTAARVGIALDTSYKINRDPGASRWVFTPLIFVGATSAILE